MPAASTSNSRLERRIRKSIKNRIIDEQLLPWITDRIEPYVDISPGDMRAIGLPWWDAGRTTRFVSRAIISDPSPYGSRFRAEAVAAPYDPLAPIDPHVLERTLIASYPRGELTLRAIANAARIVGREPDAIIDLTGLVVSRFETDLRKNGF